MATQNAQREEAVNAVKRLMTNLDKGLLPPTQAQFNQLYGDIYNFMSNALKEAQQAGKTCVFTVGEVHQVSLGQNALVVEKMMLLVAKQLGIKTLIWEGTETALHMRQFIAPMIFKDQGMGASSKADFALEVRTALLADPLAKDFKIVAGEKEDNPMGSTNVEVEMRATIAKESRNGAVLVAMGAMHLRGLSKMSSPEFKNKKLAVFPVNTVSPKRLRLMAESTGAAIDDADIAFATDPKKTTSFFIEADFSSSSAKKLLDMADKAHKIFVSQKSMESSTTKVRRRTGKTSDTTQKAAAVTSAATAPKLPTNPPVITPLPLAEAGSTSVTIAEPQHPTESIPPLSVFAQVGFWAASKLGFCANPAYGNTAVQPANNEVRMMQQEAVQEASANRKLQAQGSSLEASLHYLFGKNYAKADTAEKNRLKKFVVDVTNGEVDSSIGLRFNDFANMSNQHERGKQLITLLKEVEERAAMLGFGFS